MRGQELLLTLDTNIIVYVALRKSEDMSYAREFNEQPSRFLTHTVYKEANKLEERITQLEILLNSNKRGDEPPSKIFERLESEASKKLKEKLNRYFNNIIQHYDDEYSAGKSIDQITKEIIWEFSNFTNMDDRIRPGSEILRKSEDEISQYESWIERNNLVDREDKSIIVQMQLHQDHTNKDLKLVTRDSGFYTEDSVWQQNFPHIYVEDISDDEEQ